MEKSFDTRMVGVLLAGGTGSRMHPLTIHLNKHLIPVYMRPMIEYSLGTLLNMGLRHILVITGRDHMGQIVQLLGSGADYGEGVDLSFKVQEKAGGIAEALNLAKPFAGNRKMAVLLGDNVFDDNSIHKTAQEFALAHENYAVNFLAEVKNPGAYGVATIENEHIIQIKEKPKNPATNLAVTGLYLYPSDVFDKISQLKPSQRQELEITDINNMYIEKKQLRFQKVNAWFDAGEPEPWMETQKYVANNQDHFPPSRFRLHQEGGKNV